MTGGQDLDRALHAWLRNVPPHSDRARGAVLAQLATTPQHQGRRWRPGLRSSRAFPAARPARSHPLNGRHQAVFSATRLIALAVIVLLGASALFLAGGQGDTPSPVLPSRLSPSPVRQSVAPSSSPTSGRDILVAQDGTGDASTPGLTSA